MAERDEFSIRVNDTVLHRRTAGGPGTAAWIVARGAATSDDATPWPEARGWDGEGAATTIERAASVLRHAASCLQVYPSHAATPRLATKLSRLLPPAPRHRALHAPLWA